VFAIGHHEFVGHSFSKRFALALAVASVSLPNAGGGHKSCHLAAWLKAFKAFGRGLAAYARQQRYPSFSGWS
jgi:hypothetical protein